MLGLIAGHDDGGSDAFPPPPLFASSTIQYYRSSPPAPIAPHDEEDEVDFSSVSGSHSADLGHRNQPVCTSSTVVIMMVARPARAARVAASASSGQALEDPTLRGTWYSNR